MCEIAKAISHEAKVIVFDEPSAALTDAEIDQLFRIIRDLRAKQYGIVYISHRMDEIKKITDRVTVMRDGQTVGTLVTADSSKDDIIHMEVPASDTATTLGAAILAGVGTGVYAGFPEATARTVAVKRTHQPNEANKAVYDHGYQTYRELYERLAPMMKA